ncbi:MAG: hypothetical protein MI754_00455 [Chromatiales bacterium]|nr:hypothetical protein [Chromatiales bacterium]
MIIRCTQKLIKELRITPEEPGVLSEVGSWHANLLRIDRRKCVLFTHDKTLFSLFVAGLKCPDFDAMDMVFGQALFRALRLFDFEQLQIERMLDLSRYITYAKTNSRSVLGSMNDMAFHVEDQIACEGGLDYTDIDELRVHINKIPFKAIGYEYPWKSLYALLSERGKQH